MISPKAVHLIIKHFDAIDKVVSKKLKRKRPWSETSLTSFLCDLMDQETQNEEKLDYSIEELNKALTDIDGLLNVSFTIETHEYSPRMERWVTQSDLGFEIQFEDYLLPQQSWSIAWLLQAKKIFYDRKKTNAYSESSRFESHDLDQIDRIKDLQKHIGIEFVKNLLYCPRPSDLDDITQKKLIHLRNSRLSGNIFDYTLGLEVKDELSKTDSSLAAGIFVSPIENGPLNLGSVHQNILNIAFPLSWFIASHFTNSGFEAHNRLFKHTRRPFKKITPTNHDVKNLKSEVLASLIVKGDEKGVEEICEFFGGSNDFPIPIFPPHTMTVKISVGKDLNSNLRQISFE